MKIIKNHFKDIVFIVILTGILVVLSFEALESISTKNNLVENNFSNLFPEQNEGEIIIYTISTCPACKNLKEYLDVNNVRYIERELNSNPKHSEEFDALGSTTVPVIVGKSWAVIGFQKHILEEQLNIL